MVWAGGGDAMEEAAEGSTSEGGRRSGPVAEGRYRGAGGEDTARREDGNNSNLETIAAGPLELPLCLSRSLFFNSGVVLWLELEA